MTQDLIPVRREDVTELEKFSRHCGLADIAARLSAALSDPPSAEPEPIGYIYPESLEQLRDESVPDIMMYAPRQLRSDVGLPLYLHPLPSAEPVDLRPMLDWYVKATGDIGDDYLNDDGWDDLHEIVASISSALGIEESDDYVPPLYTHPLLSGEAVGLSWADEYKLMFNGAVIGEIDACYSESKDAEYYTGFIGLHENDLIGGQYETADEARAALESAAKAWLSPSLSETTKGQAQPDLALQEMGQDIEKRARHMLAAQLDIGLYHDDAARIRDAVDGLGTICAASAIDAVINALKASPQVQQSEGVVEAYLTDRPEAGERPLIHRKWDEKGAIEAAKHYGVPIFPLVRGVPYEV